ncbi:MAG: ATP-dependent sacrificial sulfur transferase LarE [Desulfobacteraceae bacterium]|nr:ATP-dependent sacrificial sulfur transferase LarE [Desulfobacteraceae bacterium]
MPDKLQTLVDNIKGYKKLAVAFSGGVDSSFLATAARQNCDSVVAITVKSEFQSQKETDNSVHMAETIGICHVVVTARVLEEPGVARNTNERCYFCKKALFSLLKEKAEALGFDTIAHGANLDDLSDYRPGFRAAREMGVVSPLIEAELTKQEIRDHSRAMGLETWNMASQSCLATRIPYGEPVTLEKLAMVENGEKALADLGFTRVRVRCHGEVARVELDPGSLDRLMEKELRRTVVEALKQAGFNYVAVDLEGYVSGSMNRSL